MRKRPKKNNELKQRLETFYKHPVVVVVVVVKVSGLSFLKKTAKVQLCSKSSSSNDDPPMIVTKKNNP